MNEQVEQVLNKAGYQYRFAVTGYPPRCKVTRHRGGYPPRTVVLALMSNRLLDAGFLVFTEDGGLTVTRRGSRP